MDSASNPRAGSDRTEAPETATLASFEESPPAAAGPVFLPSEVLADRFRVVRLLGRGGMGEVYEVEDLELGERVAVKTLRSGLAVGERALALFRSEIQLARRVTHPHVCRIFDVFRHQRTVDGVAESVVFLTMEPLVGETLSSRLRRDGPLTPAAALPILRQVASGLDAAHDAGVAHRDFKSGNVMLVDGGRGPRAVVTDFGLAGAEGIAGSLPSAFGTAPYRAPEQEAGGPVGPPADLYAFGVVMREMLSGDAAGGGPLPAAAAATVGCCLAERPEARPSSATGAVDALSAALAEESRTGRFAALLLALVLVAFGGLAGKAALVMHASDEPAAGGAAERAIGPAAAVAEPLRTTVAVVPATDAGGEEAWPAIALAALLDAELHGAEPMLLPRSAYGRLGYGAEGRHGDWRAGLAALGVDRLVEASLAPRRAAAVLSGPGGRRASFAGADLEALAERLAAHLRGDGVRPRPEIRRALVGDDPLARELYARARLAPTVEALPLLERAVGLQPEVFRFQSDLAGALLASPQRRDEAPRAAHEARRIADGLGEAERLFADLQVAAADAGDAAVTEALTRLAANFPERRDYLYDLASRWFESGELDAVERAVDELVRRDPGFAGDPRHLMVRTRLADDRGEMEERAAFAERLGLTAERYGLVDMAFEACWDQQDALRQLGRFAEQAAAIDRAERLVEHHGPARLAGHVARWRALAQMAQGRPAAAEQKTRQALSIAVDAGDRLNVALCHNSLGILGAWQGEFDAAESHYRSALDLSRRAGEVVAFLYAQNNLNELFYARGRLDETAEGARRLLAAAHRRGVVYLEINGLEVLARVELDSGDLEGAGQHLAMAAELAHRSDFPAFDLWLGLARWHRERGDLDQAYRWARRAVHDARSGLPVERNRALLGMARSEAATGRPERARELFERALDDARRGGMPVNAATLERELARLERRLGRAGPARHRLSRALDAHRRFGADLETAHDLLEIAELQLAEGSATAAEESARQALAVYERLGAWAGARAAKELLRRGPAASGLPPGNTVASAPRAGRPLW